MPRIPRPSEGGEEPTPDKQDLSDAPPVTPASTAAPSDAQVAPGDASSAQASEPQPTVAAESVEQPTVASDRVEQPTEASSPVEQHTVAAAPVEQPTAVLPTGHSDDLAAEPGEQAPVDARPRFRQRTRMRRRLRYLRRLRELAFRDLGGLVFDLHRFGRERNDLVTAKLDALATIDRELRTLQEALADRRDFTDLREAGIAACPRCGTLHDTDANYCPGCGSTLRSVLVREAFPVKVTPADEQPGTAQADKPAGSTGDQDAQSQQPPQQPTPAS